MRRIVVGIDGSAGARKALLWAYDEACLRGARIEAITAWTYPAAVGAAGFAPVPDLQFEDAASTTLRETVAAVIGLHPDVVVEEVVSFGSPAEVLLTAAKDAELLVVGNRGRGGFVGLLLGSVSQQVAHHAPCPVVIIPEK